MPVTDVFPVRYEHLLHIKGKAMPVTGVFPVRYENHLQTPWPLVRERTIPTERPPLVDEI
jgi:hypothetical protein